MHITRQTSQSPHHEPPLNKVRRGRREKKHLLKVRKNRDSNQGLGPEAEPLPTMLREAWSPKITNHYNFKAGARETGPAPEKLPAQWSEGDGLRGGTHGQLEGPRQDLHVHSPPLSPAPSLSKLCASVTPATEWSTESHPSGIGEAYTGAPKVLGTQ